MAKAKGVSKRLSYKKETTFGVLAGDTGGTQMRRVTSDFNLKRESYTSSEIRFDRMKADLRLGSRSADGSINGELSPGSYSDFIGSILAKNFVAGATATGASITIAASGSNFTLTRAAGSFLTDAFKVGTVVRLTGAGLNVANAANNLLVVSVTALVLTVLLISRVALVAEGPIAAVTVTTVGKQSYVPKIAHTEDSYTVEQWFSDISQSEVYTGMKVGGAAISLPATGLVTSNFTFMGKDLTQTGTTAYFTNPTAASTKGTFAAVNGALMVNGAQGACITSMDISIECAMEPTVCLGTDSADDIFSGEIKVTGNFSAYFEDGSIRDYFKDETKVTLVVALTTTDDKNSDVMTFVIPFAKLSSHETKDAELGIIQSAAFTALLNDDTTTGLIDSVILVQDSTLV
jgi:hypothetical protein